MQTENIYSGLTGMLILFNKDNFSFVILKIWGVFARSLSYIRQTRMKRAMSDERKESNIKKKQNT